MVSLQKVICRGGYENYVLDNYEYIQKHYAYNGNVNTDIEIILEERRTWKDSDCIFDEKF